MVYYVTSDARYLLYIPPIAKLEDSDISLQQAIIQECHDALYAGHYGSAKTTLRVQQQFHWPGMHDDIALYCNTCVSCVCKLRRRNTQQWVTNGDKWLGGAQVCHSRSFCCVQVHDQHGCHLGNRNVQ